MIRFQIVQFYCLDISKKQLQLLNKKNITESAESYEQNKEVDDNTFQLLRNTSFVFDDLPF